MTKKKEKQPKAVRHYVAVDNEKQAAIYLTLWCVYCEKKSPAPYVYKGASCCEEHLKQSVQAGRGENSERPKTGANPDAK